jgi:spore coat protein U-like protein
MPRTMKLTDSLPYNLYTSASGNPPPIWGDGSGGSSVITLTTTPQSKDFDLTIEGIMPVSSDVAPGVYTDNVSVTVNDNKAGDPDSHPLEIRVQVLPECNVGTFSMNFGTYSPAGTNASNPLPATSTVTVKCTKTTIGTVQLNAGQWSAGGVRNLRSATGELLAYNLFLDSSYATVWNLTNTMSDTSQGRATPLGGGAGFTIYGRIPANQDVSAGAYNDTVQAIVNY